MRTRSFFQYWKKEEEDPYILVGDDEVQHVAIQRSDARLGATPRGDALLRAITTRRKWQFAFFPTVRRLSFLPYSINYRNVVMLPLCAYPFSSHIFDTCKKYSANLESRKRLVMYFLYKIIFHIWDCDGSCLFMRITIYILERQIRVFLHQQSLFLLSNR